MTEPNDNRSNANRWTPDLLIQGFKELVTALLGVMVVLYTLLLAGTALSYAGDATKMSNAKDILLLVLGLAGVVIGYYFGRVPADARATQAGEQADQANAQAAEVSARAGAAADQVDEMMGRAGRGAVLEGAAGRGAEGQAKDDTDDLRRLRDTLRALSRS